MADRLPSPRLTPRDVVLLGTAVAARGALGLARYAATPERFRNFEEGYNATVAWVLAHGAAPAALLDLQYRSFCGGCTVVAVAGMPAMAATDRLWAWKLVPLFWTAATQLLGFFALDAWLGRAAAWAFVVLFALPPVGALDLSLMAWGNHQETALFAVLALGLLAKGRGAAAGFVLGFAVWFARTAAYEALVLLPLALTLRGQRLRTLAAFAAGLALLALPAAGGDAGWYRMDEAVGADAAATLGKRAATLLVPGPLAARLYLPLRDMAPAAGVLLVVAAAALTWASTARRARWVAALPLAYAAAFIGTRFPIFLIGAKVPVNNLRYHAPWAFALTLLVAAGVGVAWRAGRRRRAVFAAAVWAVANSVSLARVGWAPDPRAWTLPALDVPHFVATVAPRLTAEAGRPAQARDAAAAPTTPAGALHARLHGLALGHAVRAGELDAATAVAQLRGGEFGGYGEAVVVPCGTVAAAEAALAGVPVPERLAAERGAALTLSFCEESPPLAVRIPAFAVGTPGAPYASALGRALLDGCGGPRNAAGAALGGCLAAAAADLPDEALFGAGRAWGDPMRDPGEVVAVAEALGARGPDFATGATDPTAGTRQPSFARENARPGPR